MADDPLADELFRFQHLKGDRVMLYHHNRHVVTLGGTAARRFLYRANGLDGEPLQRLMAKATKNFKRGNERQA
jgi:hypothetical protein